MIGVMHWAVGIAIIVVFLSGNTSGFVEIKDNVEILPVLHGYFISLSSAPERRQFMYNMFAGLSHREQLKVSLVEATTVNVLDDMIQNEMLKLPIDVKLLSADEEARAGTGHFDPLYLLKKEHKYTKTEAAVVISHVRAIREAHDAGHDMALIMEDDVVLTDKFMEHWRGHMAMAPADWQVLQIIHTNEPVAKQNQHVVEPWVTFQPQHYSTACYLINRVGMNEVLKRTAGTSSNSWHFRTPRMLVADELVYLLPRRSYTSTYGGMVRINYSLKSTVLRNTLRDYTKHESLWSANSSRLTLQNPLLLKRSLLVLTIVAVAEATEVELQIQQLFTDMRTMEALYAKGKVHWRVHVATASRSLLTKCRLKMKELLKSHAYAIKTSWSSSLVRVNTYNLLRNATLSMAKYDDVLWKENGYTLTGFPWATFLDKRGEAVVATTLFEDTVYSIASERNEFWKKTTRGGYLMYSGYHMKQQKGAPFVQLRPMPVNATLQHFNIFDGAFAAWYFEKLLMPNLISRLDASKPRPGSTTPTIGRDLRSDDSGLVGLADDLSCGAAREWLNAMSSIKTDREPCMLVPLVLSERTKPHTMVKSKRAKKLLRTYVGGETFLEHFPVWKKYSETWRRQHMIKMSVKTGTQTFKKKIKDYFLAL